MTDLRQQQTAIRAVAARGRDHVGWTAVCALLDQLSDDAVRAHAGALLASAHLPSLARLELTHNELGDEIVGAVASSPLVTRLVSLTLDDTYLSDEARAALQSLPLPAEVLDLWLLRED